MFGYIANCFVLTRKRQPLDLAQLQLHVVQLAWLMVKDAGSHRSVTGGELQIICGYECPQVEVKQVPGRFFRHLD